MKIKPPADVTDFQRRPARGRHDVGHFGKATGRGVFTDVGQLTVVTGSDGFRLTSYKWHNSKSGRNYAKAKLI